METLLFHKDVFAPDFLFQTSDILRLRYGPHALDAAENDHYGDLRPHLPRRVDLGDPDLSIVEVEVLRNGDNASISKRVVRYPVSNTLTLVLVVTADGFVRTVWGNRTDDNHRTLKRHLYVQAPKTLH